MIDCKNYVITHKAMPVHEDELYKGLCVGGIRYNDMLAEQDGENIMQYNDRINELTGLYWIWKNTDCEYVGLSHYRRFFTSNDGSRLNKDDISEIMKEYDIILSPIVLPWSIYHNIGMASGYDLAAAAHEAFRESINKHQPEYVETFDQVMNETWMYRCNLFVTRREIMNTFCKWLFSFLLEATDKIDVSRLGFYEKRVCGYFGETMWTVWTRKNKPHVYEMQIGG